jgi:hypothetical protein
LYELLHYSSDPTPQDIILTTIFAVTKLSHSELVQTIGLPDIEKEEIMHRLLSSDNSQRAIVKVRGATGIISVNGLVPI